MKKGVRPAGVGGTRETKRQERRRAEPGQQPAGEVLVEALTARKPCPRQLHLKPAQGAAGPAVTLSLHEGTEPATARGERPCPGSPSLRPVSGQGSPLQRDAADGWVLPLQQRPPRRGWDE